MKLFSFTLPWLLTVMFCFADDGAGINNPKLGTFTVLKSEDIAMIDEVVDIYRDKVNANFRFRNLLPVEKEVTFGFPVIDFPRVTWGPGSQDREFVVNETNYKEHLKEIEDYYVFTSYVNKKQVKRTISFADSGSGQDGEHKTYYFVLNVTFKPNEIITIENFYNQSADSFGDSMGNSGFKYVYILTTGSSWAAPIEKAEIRFHNNETNSLKYAFDFTAGAKIVKHIDFNYEPTAEYISTDEHITYWKFSDWLPRKNLEITEVFEYTTPPGFAWLTYLMEKTGFLKDEEIFDRYIFSIWPSPGQWQVDKLHKITVTDFKKDIIDTYHFIFFDMNNKPLEFDDRSGVSKKYAGIVKNAIYALHGYQFNNQKLKAFFSFFDWYNGLLEFDSGFSEYEKQIIVNLLKIEK